LFNSAKIPWSKASCFSARRNEFPGKKNDSGQKRGIWETSKEGRRGGFWLPATKNNLARGQTDQARRSPFGEEA